MRIAAIGGLGLMLSPAAIHLGGASSPVHVTRLLDRGRPGAEREAHRKVWREHGARCVTNYDELLADDHGEPLEGVIVCAGKNGDDRVIIRKLVQRLSAAPPLEGNTPRFIIHLSTVSARFAQAATEYAQARGVAYGNYPLTGGPGGAKAATMLILASGDMALYDRVEPLLERLGRPKHISPKPSAGAETKLIGHYLVFHALMGVTAGATLQHAVLPELDAVEYFDYLNQGAGHTRQWEMTLRKGLSEGQWETGFYCRHAAVDALYALQLGMDRGLPMVTLLPMFQIALLFALAVQSGLAQKTEFATHAIYQQVMGAHGRTADKLLADILDLRAPQKTLNNLLKVLPPGLRDIVQMDITGPEYFDAA